MMTTSSPMVRSLRCGVDLGLLEPPRVVDVDRLPLGEDVERGLARLAVPVPGVLRAAEREVHLGADRARVDVRDPSDEVAHRAERLVHVAGEDRRREAVADPVRDAHRLVEVAHGDERGRRAEDLLLRDPHLRIDVAEDRRPVVEPVAEAVAARDLAAREELRALVLPDLRVGVDLLERALVDHGADVGLVLPAGAEAHLLGDRDELRLERVVHTVLDDHAARGRAALAGGAEGRPDDPVDGQVEIGVVEDDDRVLAAELEVDVLERVGRVPHHLDPGLARARERKRALAGVLGARVADRAAAAVEDVDDPRRQARLGEQLDEALAEEWRVARRLEDHGVPADERGRELPRRDRDREVPRRDRAHDADRHPHAHVELVLELGRRRLAEEAPALAGHVVAHVDRFLDVAPGFGLDLAHLPGHEVGQLVLRLLEKPREAEEDLAALRRRYEAPLLVGLLRRRDRSIGVLGAGLGEDTQRLARRGTAGLEGLAARGVDPLAADEVLERRGLCRRHADDSRRDWRDVVRCTECDARSEARTQVAFVAGSYGRDRGRRIGASSELRAAFAAAGALDLLVNNAGGVSSPFFPDAPPERWGAVLDVNLRATMLGIQLALETMRGRGGAIVNVASIAGVGCEPHGAPEYAVAKAGVVRLTGALASLAGEGVRVNCICPDWVDTPAARRSLEKATPEERAAAPPLVPSARVADAILDLVKDDGLAGRVLVCPATAEWRLLPARAQSPAGGVHQLTPPLP